MKKKIIKILTIITLLTILSGLTYSDFVQANLSDNLIRLHIIANSDSELDQAIKLKVRDRIIQMVGDDFAHIQDKEVYRERLLDRSEEIRQIADEVLTENGVSYQSQISFEKLYIPRKTYDGIILPEGRYEGLIVRLGNASGQNWWCVVYPPLCFTENTSGELSDEGKEYLKENLSSESYSLITKEGISIEYKFKLLEYVQKAKHISSDFMERHR